MHTTHEPCPVAVAAALRALRLPTSRGELAAILFRIRRSGVAADPAIDPPLLASLWREARDETLAAVEG